MKRVHIIIADPSTIMRRGLVALLQSSEINNIDIAEVGDIANIVVVSQRNTPDILIVNPAQMGTFSPQQYRAELGNENLRIIALKHTFTEPTISALYDDAITIYDSAESIIELISRVAAIEVESTAEGEADSRKVLSSREREIVICVVKGMTNKVIAETLFLSTHTVIAHRRNIAHKLQISSASGLTIYAIVNGLVNLEDIAKGAE
ncbi:MAG: LuxR C-terminal-related transcriptional regulator [Rikenellaceae bacterium]